MQANMIADMKDSYGLTCSQITPVTGGLLNRKWKVSTEKGDLLVKQYSLKRFTRENIETIESRLQRQILLEKMGVPCPVILTYGGRAIRWLDGETAYMVMEFRAGKTESPDTITVAQMRSLGSACAVMHKAFSQLPEPSETRLPAFGGYSMALLQDNFISRMASCPSDAPAGYRQALLAQEPIIKSLDTGFFDRFPKGYTHEDFHSGNILFDGDRVVIVDFDRNCNSYVWHDIGRAVLSFALEGNGMNAEKVRAFIDGYSEYSMLTIPDIADTLRLTWCIETTWWIQSQFFGECDKIPQRFKDEMLWLTEHWFELDLLNNITYRYN